MKYLLILSDSVRELRVLDRCKRDFSIGFGLISLVSIICQFAMLFSDDSDNMFLCLYNMCTVSSFFALAFFTFNLRTVCYLDYENYGKFSFGMQFTYFMVISISFIKELNGWKLIYQLIIALTTSSCITDFWVVLNGDIHLCAPVNRRVGEEQNVDSDSGSDGEEGESMGFKELECPICYLQYNADSKKRTPRNLKCGHTVCHQCAKSMSTRRNSNVLVKCTFCQETTSVHNSVSNIPKNWLAVGLIQEMKRNKEEE